MRTGFIPSQSKVDRRFGKGLIEVVGTDPEADDGDRQTCEDQSYVTSIESLFHGLLSVLLRAVTIDRVSQAGQLSLSIDTRLVTIGMTLPALESRGSSIVWYDLSHEEAALPFSLSYCSTGSRSLGWLSISPLGFSTSSTRQARGMNRKGRSAIDAITSIGGWR